MTIIKRATRQVSSASEDIMMIRRRYAVAIGKGHDAPIASMIANGDLPEDHPVAGVVPHETNPFMPDTFDREAIVELARTNVVKATRMAKEAGAPLEFFIGPQSGTFSVTPKNTTREVGPGVTQDDGHPEQAKVQDRPSLEVIKERVRKLTMPEQIGDAATKLGAVLTPGLLDPDKPTPDQETPPAEPAVPSNKPVPKTSGALKRPIVIPRDYLALPWKSLQNLAGRISGEKPASRNDALAIIEAYAAEKQK